ncbi:chaplin, partial [Streptomyces sp. NPDC058469]|uniref:chaplin n=1 Tax=Streptomyces sp. NPDC058469 TaxID=3346514 RepID=UPI00365A9D5B
MRQTLGKGMVAAAAATSILSLCGSPALADSYTGGAAKDSPGVLSGNSLEVPVDAPVNACGDTVDVVSGFNPTFGNSCAGGKDEHRHGEHGDHHRWTEPSYGDSDDDSGYGYGDESGYGSGGDSGYGHGGHTGYGSGGDSGYGHGDHTGYGHGDHTGYGHGDHTGHGHGDHSGYGTPDCEETPPPPTGGHHTPPPPHTPPHHTPPPPDTPPPPPRGHHTPPPRKAHHPTDAKGAPSNKKK